MSWKNQLDFEICAIVFLFLLMLILFFTAGCIEMNRNREESQHQRRDYNETGTQAGQPYTKSGTETVVTEIVEKEATKTGLDPEAVRQLTASITSAVVSSVIPALPKPLTGSAQVDGMLQTILAYLMAKGGIAGAGKLRRKERPA